MRSTKRKKNKWGRKEDVARRGDQRKKYGQNTGKGKNEEDNLT